MDIITYSYVDLSSSSSVKWAPDIMPKTCENWLGLVTICIYYTLQTHEIYQLMFTRCISKFPIEWNIYECKLRSVYYLFISTWPQDMDWFIFWI